jgi:light-regulated signal transduction histidine kinase (bacteriophytochrome)
MEISHADVANIHDSLGRSGQNCASEPIRIPGSIQRHGFLLLLDDRDEHVVAASQDTEDFLQFPLGLILGTSIETILEREILGALRAHSSDDEGLLTYLGSFQMRGHFFSVVTHRVHGERILEFELTDRLVNPEMTNQVFSNFVSKLSSLRSE